MGNVIHSVSLPVKSAAEAQLSVLKYEGTNISAYVRRLIEDDATGLPSHVEAALRIQVRYLEACLAATGHAVEDFVPIDDDIEDRSERAALHVKIKEDCE